MQNAHIRQADLFVPIDDPILIIGAGGIGSTTAMVLAKMGCNNMTVIDYDKVEEHNINSQLYGPDDRGFFKVNALKKNVELLSGVDINVSTDKITDSIPKGFRIVILAVDSVDSRKDIVRAVGKDFELLIDGRMGGEVVDLYTFTPYTIDDFEKTLPTEEEITYEICTGKAIAYNTFTIGSWIGNIVKRFTKGEKIERNIEFLFKELMIFKH